MELTLHTVVAAMEPRLDSAHRIPVHTTEWAPMDLVMDLAMAHMVVA
jgi:hypothetical protein